jgi:hypothetical protein
MLGLPSIAMVGFGLAALVTRHWRYRIQREARRNAMSPNHVHLALDPVRWGNYGEERHSKNLPDPAFQKRARQDPWCEQAPVDLLKPHEQSEAEFVSINCEPQDSTVRAAQRRQAFKVISNA